MEQDIKLIAPAVPQDESHAGAEAPPESRPLQWYKLAHDFLVGSLREWLDEDAKRAAEAKQKAEEERKQKLGKTWHGRKKLQLEAFTQRWEKTNRDPRFGPTVIEHLPIDLAVLWMRYPLSDGESDLLKAARRKSRVTFGTLALLCLLIWVSIWAAVQWTTATQWVRNIETANGDALGRLIAEKRNWLVRFFSNRELNRRIRDASNLSQATGATQANSAYISQLSAALGEKDSLRDHLLKSRWEDFEAVYQAIEPKDDGFRAFLEESLHSEKRKFELQSDDSATASAFRAGVGLARLTRHKKIQLTPNDWAFLALMMVQVAPEDARLVRELLSPVKDNLDLPLQELLTESEPNLADIPIPPNVHEYWREMAADALRLFHDDDANALCDLATKTNSSRFGKLLEGILRGSGDKTLRTKAIAKLKAIVEELPSNTASCADDHQDYEFHRVELGTRRAKAAFALIRLGESDAATKVLEVVDGDPEAQTQFIHRFQEFEVKGKDIWSLYSDLQPERPPDTSKSAWEYHGDLRYALLLCLGKLTPQNLSELGKNKIISEAEELYKTHPYASIHGAARWLLTQLKWPPTNAYDDRRDVALEVEKYFNELDRDIFEKHVAQDTSEADRLWFVRKLDIGPTEPVYRTFVRCDGGLTIKMGMPNAAKWRIQDFNRYPDQPTIDANHKFAICTQEVTRGEFDEYRESMHEEPWRDTIFDWHSANDKRATDIYKRCEVYSPNSYNPVTKPRWFDAINFCIWLSERDYGTEVTQHHRYRFDFGTYERPKKNEEWKAEFTKFNDGGRDNKPLGYRLAKQDEWDYACRAGTSTSFNFGSDFALAVEYAWFLDNRDRNLVSKLGCQKIPNRWGLFDMHGNMNEWCEDVGFFIGPEGKVEGPDNSRRAVRGGGWLEPAFKCRSAWLYKYGETHSDAGFGFRLVCIPEE